MPLSCILSTDRASGLTESVCRLPEAIEKQAVTERLDRTCERQFEHIPGDRGMSHRHKGLQEHKQ
jgi:hypothetical protein